MHITLLISSLSDGGAERVVCNLANHLAAHGHDVEVLSVSDLISYKPNDNVKVVPMYRATKSKLPKSIINICRMYNFNRYLRKNKRDVYVSFLPGLTVKLLKQRHFFNAPVIIAERADPEKYCQQSASNNRNFKKYYPLGDGFVFQTEDAKAYYNCSGIDITNSIVIPNAINPVFIKDPYEGERENVIVSVGRLNHQKNFPLLINAFAKVAAKQLNYRLRIYGKGELLEELKNLAASLNISNRVEFPGYVNNVQDVLQKASLFVLSSDFEGMPNALAEAMALGLPCISTDCPVGGPKFLIQDGENGILVPVGEVGPMASAMEEILSNKEYADKLGNEARKICEKLSPEKIYCMWEEFLKETIDRNKIRVNYN